MAKKKKPRKLIELNIEEISLVDSPANMKAFYFVKNDEVQDASSLRISSDGTLSGTSVKLNGEEVENIEKLMFSFSPGDDNHPISFSIVQEDGAGSGLSRINKTNNNSKGVLVMDKLIELMKEFIDDDILTDEVKEKIEKGISKEDIKVLKDSLSLLSKYKEDFPVEVVKAIGVLIKCAGIGMATKPVKKDDSEDIDKAGARFSKETTKLLKEVVAKLENMADAIAGLKKLVEPEKPVKKNENDEEKFEVTADEIEELVKTKVTEALEKVKKDI